MSVFFVAIATLSNLEVFCLLATLGLLLVTEADFIRFPEREEAILLLGTVLVLTDLGIQ